MLETVPREVTVSCPGKMLLTGGYQVLLPGNSGIVLNSGSRIFVSVKSIVLTEDSSPRKKDILNIIVSSPQFGDGYWEFTARIIGSECNSGSIKTFNCIEGSVPRVCLSRVKGPRNKYISTTLQTSLSAAYSKCPETVLELVKSQRTLVVTILADNDFYSQKTNIEYMINASCKDSSPSLFVELALKNPPMSYVKGVTIEECVKTGLGSSSALVSAFSSALMIYLCEINLDDSKQRDNLYCVPQLTHFLIQRLIGSGVDVASAFYGSQKFTSIDYSSVKDFILKRKNLVSERLANSENEEKPCELCLDFHLIGTDVVGKCIRELEVLNSNSPKENISLPPGIFLLSLDFSTGQKSTEMSKKFIQWFNKEKNTSEAHMKELKEAWSEWYTIIVYLVKCYEERKEEYTSTVEFLASRPASSWKESSQGSPCKEIALKLAELSEVGSKTRTLFRRLGNLAEIPTEPVEYTPILDCICKMNGVIWAGTLGAGGYDIISYLILSENVHSCKEEEFAARIPIIASTYKAVAEFVAQEKLFPDASKSPLPLLEGTVSYFDPVFMQGLRVESSPPYSIAYNASADPRGLHAV